MPPAMPRTVDPRIVPAEPKTDQPWLVMVYMAADNDLTEEMVLTLQELHAEGPPQDDVVVAQFDPSGTGLLTQRYAFTEAGGNKKLEVVDVRNETNVGNTRTLVDFISWAVQNYGGLSKRHLLVLSGHGSGITEDFFLRDDDSRDSLTIAELRDALVAAQKLTGKKIDILGLDACFMAMGEVAYQIREQVGILIAAEGLEPAFGWPYRRILAAAKARCSDGKIQSMTPRELAVMIVDEYVKNYADYDLAAGRSADLAAIDLTGMDSLADAVKNLVKALRADGGDQHRDLITLAHWYAQTYKADQFVDLRDFCVQLQARFKADNGCATGAAVHKACAEVRRVLGEDGGNGRCIIRSGCTGFAHQHSYGISVYFPWAILSPDYGELDFAKFTDWYSFLHDHVRDTRRELRETFTVSSPANSIEDDIKAIGHLRLCRLGKPEAPGPDGMHEIPAPDAAETATTDLSKIGELAKASDVPEEDKRRELHRRVLRKIGPRGSRYTGVGSKYTGVGSKYTGVGSKYTEGTRLPSDREKSVKNLAVGSGVAFWPPAPKGRPGVETPNGQLTTP